MIPLCVDFSFSPFLSHYAQRGRMGFVCLHQQGIRVQNKYADLSYSLEGLFIGKYRAQTYTTNHANLGANYGMRIVSLVVIITSVIILFELAQKEVFGQFLLN